MDKEFMECLKACCENLYRIGDRMAYADSDKDNGITIAEAIIMSGDKIAEAIDKLTDKFDDFRMEFETFSANVDAVTRLDDNEQPYLNCHSRIGGSVTTY